MEQLTFRYAEETDVSIILYFIRELADYEKMLDQVVATEELLREWIFEKKKQKSSLQLKTVKRLALRCSFTIFRLFSAGRVFTLKIYTSSQSIAERDTEKPC